MITAAPAVILFKKVTMFWALITATLFAQEILKPTSAASPSIGLDATTITLIGGMIVTIIGTIVTGVVTIITALRLTPVVTAQALATTRIDAVAKDTEAIKGHVNSEKTASIGREVALRSENTLLREIIADKKATAGLLAQAVAQTPSSVPPERDGK